MTFATCLRNHLNETGCSARELAAASGVAEANLSRYLAGKRIPSPEGDVMAKLARGLAGLKGASGSASDDEDEIRAELARAARGGEEGDSLPQRLVSVMDAFGMANNRLARFLGYDASYISRIRSGQRRPADIGAFAEGVASYVVRNFHDEAGIAAASQLTGEQAGDLASSPALARAIASYLTSDEPVARITGSAVGSFLAKLDGFDLGAFLRAASFPGDAPPHEPFGPGETRTYAGIEEMKQAELDFLMEAARADATGDVILYSDMPLGDMASDREFAKRIMMGMAALVRKGICLRNIHDVHRPVNELFMGLEGWLPLYMTGQVSPYYLPHRTGDEFLHFIRSAGTVASTGEAIAGKQARGRYMTTADEGEVAYLRQRAEDLLSRARPLMRVFPGAEAAELAAPAGDDVVQVGQDTFANMTITVKPGSFALIEKVGDPPVALLVEYPALVDALERYEPTLF